MMKTKGTSFRLLRYFLYLAAILLALAFMSTRLSVFPLYDFVQYWSGATLNLINGNPYSPDDMLRVQIEAGWDENIPPNMLFIPPNILGLILPLGLLPYDISRLLWFVASLLIIAAFAELGWQIYGGSQRYRWLAWVLLLTFGPILQTLKIGQIVPLQMLGLIGFLFFMRKGHFFLAGLAASLMLLKPHTVYLFWIALLLWSLPRKTWRLWWGIAAGIALPMAVALIANPQVITQYLQFLQTVPPRDWITATLGLQLRLLFGIEKFWLQFVPSLIGGLLFVAYYLRQRVIWSWEAQAPLIIVASAASAAYGWVFDLPVCGIAILAVAAQLAGKRLNTAQILLTSVFVATSLALGFVNQPQNFFWWGGCLLLLLYWLFQRTIYSAENIAPRTST